MADFISSTRKGYVTVKELTGELVSQHTDWDKAVTSAGNHVLDKPAGYEVEVMRVVRVKKENPVFTPPMPPAPPPPQPATPPAPSAAGAGR
jgi:hypothetical protein